VTSVRARVAIPHLVRIHRQRQVVDWNTYALAATVELARGVKTNPDVPEWARGSYDEALRELGRLGLEELPRAANPETVWSILGLLALVNGRSNVRANPHRVHRRRGSRTRTRRVWCI
jgi:hypothetical protein